MKFVRCVVGHVDSEREKVMSVHPSTQHQSHDKRRGRLVGRSVGCTPSAFPFPTLLVHSARRCERPWFSARSAACCPLTSRSSPAERSAACRCSPTSRSSLAIYEKHKQPPHQRRRRRRRRHQQQSDQQQQQQQPQQHTTVANRVAQLG